MFLTYTILISVFCVLTNANSVLWQEAFTDYTYQSRFDEQYSYNEHTSTGEKQHFQIVPFNGRNVLRISLYATDLTFQSGSPTEPRSELREKLFTIQPNVEYEVSWEWYLLNQSSYQFGFMQLFQNTVPNVMLRWENNAYLLYFANHYVTMGGHISNDVGKWINWRVTFCLSTTSTKGYVYVYKDTVLLGSYKGATLTTSTTSYFKQGIYTQHVAPEDTTTLISNLVFSTGSGTSYANIADTTAHSPLALSQGAIIGIAVGCAVTVLVVVIIIVVVIKLRGNNMQETV